MAIQIRELTGNDARHSIASLCALLADSIEDNASMGFMAQYDAQQVEGFWQTVASGVDAGAVTLLVAEDDGQIVGTVHAGLVEKPNQPHRADVMKLIVHRNARGKGISRLLMEALEAECLKRGRWLLVLDTATGSAAEVIYPRLGWIKSGVVPDYALYPDGSYCGSTIFYKRLSV